MTAKGICVWIFSNSQPPSGNPDRLSFQISPTRASCGDASYRAIRTKSCHLRTRRVNSRKRRKTSSSSGSPKAPSMRNTGHLSLSELPHRWLQRAMLPQCHCAFGSTSRSSARLPRPSFPSWGLPTLGPLCDGWPLPSRAYPLRSRMSTNLQSPPRRMLTKNSSIGILPPSISAKRWPSTGSMWHAMETPMVCIWITIGRSGPTAIGSSMLSTAICPSINSPSSNLRAIYSRTRRNRNWSPPALTDATSRPPKGVRSTTSSCTDTPSIAPVRPSKPSSDLRVDVRCATIINSIR